MHVDRKQFIRALRTAVLVSKRAPKGRRDTRVEVAHDFVRVSATDGAVWYERTLPRGWQPAVERETFAPGTEPAYRVFTADSEVLVKSARKLHDLDKLAPNATDKPLCGLDPRVGSILPREARALPLDLLAAVEFSATRDETRFHLNGVQLAWEPGKLWARATDGHRATRAWVKSDHPNKAAIVPLRAVELTLEVFGRVGETAVRLGDDAVQVGHHAEVLAARPIDAMFPPFEQVFPRQFAGTARNVSRAEAEASARAVGAFTGSYVKRETEFWTAYVDVDFAGGGGRVLFSGLPEGVREGSAGCWTPADVEGAGSTRVDAHYLAEALACAPDEQVAISVSTDQKMPLLVLRSDGARVHWEHLIMPIRK